MQENSVVIVEAVRTPLGKKKGALSNVHPVNLAANVLQALIQRAQINPERVGDVIMGCVTQVNEQSTNIARNAWLAAGFPVSVPATTVDRQCGSSQQAIHFAASLIASGEVEVAVAGGVESMTRTPIGSNIPAGPAGYPYPPELLEKYPLTMQGPAAEAVARLYKLTREDLDKFALESHRRAANAQKVNAFRKEIVSLSNVYYDEGIRPDTSLEKLAALKPAFSENGLHTAGNSSQISDGAAALLLMSQKFALENGFRPRARIVAQLVVGSDPVLMLTGPIVATPLILKKVGLRLEDLDAIEINEAFAAVVLAWEKEFHPDMSKVNPLGGAIALGHPLGASGARLMTTLLHHLESTNGRYGYQVMCCGGGLGTATIIERM